MNKLQTPSIIIMSLLFIAIYMSLPPVAQAAAQAQEAKDERVRLLVKIDPAAQNEAQVSIASAFALESVLPEMGWEVIEVDAAVAGEVMAQLQRTPGIVEVTPDYPLELAWSPNDPGFAQGNQWALDKIGADIAWEFSSGEEIIVAVLDSGIDPNHPDFVGRTVPGWNFTDDGEGETDTSDRCGHGTHVSGIIAASTDNSEGVAGVAHQAKIMPLKVIGDNCMGSYGRLMQAINYAVNHGVRILSITSGGGFDHTGLHDALKYAKSKGVFVAVAAGNRGNDLAFYPGSYAESFTVAGTNETDGQYANSNFGQQIDISAPATTIYSTYFDRTKGSTYAYMTGTSMAAPHVAAVAALILSIDPKLPLVDLEDVLTSSATDLGAAGWDPNFGWGRLTAWRAVAAVSPADGNIRIGHYRVPEMDPFAGTNATATTDEDSILLNWTQEPVAADQTVVVYRSVVPVFEGAEDIAEVAATSAGTFDDTNVEIGRQYYYWLVQADNDVEVAITEVLNAKVTAAPQEPEEPGQPTNVALYMPVVQTGN